jgi:hypothetical protein
MQTYASCDGALPATYKFQDSQLVEAQTADGNVWKRAEEGKWQLYSGPPQDLELRLSESGDCVIFKNGEIVAIKHRQGLDIEFKYTGEREIKKNEKVIEIVYPDGSFVTLNAASPGITDEDDQSSQQSEMRLGM